MTDDRMDRARRIREMREGVVDRDGEFVIWTRPELASEDTAG